MSVSQKPSICEIKKPITVKRTVLKVAYVFFAKLYMAINQCIVCLPEKLCKKWIGLRGFIPFPQRSASSIFNSALKNVSRYIGLSQPIVLMSSHVLDISLHD